MLGGERSGEDPLRLGLCALLPTSELMMARAAEVYNEDQFLFRLCHRGERAR
jgi:hypothetical protein